jgi:transglutaminase-like putative cysteine protease
MMKLAEEEIRDGNLTRAITIADSLKELSAGNRTVFLKADSIADIASRIKLDFSSNPEETISSIEGKLGPVSQDKISSWEKKGWLEARMIDGKKMYFKRAASNLLRLVKFHENKDQWRSDLAKDSDMISRLSHTSDVINAYEDGYEPEPVSMRITYTLTVHADAVPDGETIRCWLPYPRKDIESQKNIVFLDATDPDHYISPDSSVHSSVFMKAKARQGEPTVFSVSYTYDSYPRYVDPDSIKSVPYDTSTSIYRKYTRQELPHINFSREVKRLADSITAKGDTPVQAVRKIYLWFKENMPWTGALEYSTIPDITRYAVGHRRGDCGIQTILFMSMLRYKGIPVRWQSGWMMPPDADNLHDWCEVYYEGTGWVPVDVSYDLQNSQNWKIREFYLTGIDAYRLVVNTGLAGDLHPPKEYLRSEPYDFQRGEVEWSGGNLYFDKWNYDMEIEYLN